MPSQKQNTFILKRKWEPNLHKKGHNHRILRNRQFIYDLVEDTNVKRKPDMEVVLTAFVDGLGDRGAIVNVRPNFAYNKLLLAGLAVYKTPENIAKYKPNEENVSGKLHSSPFAQRTINVFQKRVVCIVMNKFQPWVVQPWHIRASMRKSGLYVADESCIELPKEPITGPDVSKNNKEFIVTVTINNLEKAKVRCRIFHWSNDPKTRMPYVVSHWTKPAELLFPDDETQWLPPDDDSKQTPPINA